MPPKKKPTKRTATKIRDTNPRLLGYLLIVFGFVCLFINFDLITGLEWLKAYPLLLVLAGFIFLVKITISRD